MKASLLLALLLLSAAAGAQVPPTRQLPEPRLVDSPWGDFPLGRLQPGARLRLTPVEGRRSEARLIALGDSALELRMAGGDSLVSVTLADLHALRAFEVRAMPAKHERSATGGLIVGAVAGAIVGAATHKDGRGAPDDEDRPGLAEDIGASASLGGLIGWSIGFYVLGRTRWRLVTLP